MHSAQLSRSTENQLSWFDVVQFSVSKDFEFAWQNSNNLKEKEKKKSSKSISYEAFQGFTSWWQHMFKSRRSAFWLWGKLFMPTNIN